MRKWIGLGLGLGVRVGFWYALVPLYDARETAVG